MTFERSPGPRPSRARRPIAGDRPGEPTPVQIRLQILSTEHWSLLASRGLAWNESFSRAGMYLSTLSGAIVALSLIGGVDGFHDAFFVVALVVLPVVLFVGVGTWLRMGATNYHDAIAVVGMNRIRAAYLEIAPDLEPYFVMGVHDDAAGVGITMAVPPGTSPIVHLIAGTPTLVMVLNGVVSGAIAALALIRFAQRRRRGRARGWPRRGDHRLRPGGPIRALEDPPGTAGPRADVPDAVGGRTARPVTVDRSSRSPIAVTSRRVERRRPAAPVPDADEPVHAARGPVRRPGRGRPPGLAPDPRRGRRRGPRRPGDRPAGGRRRDGRPGDATRPAGPGPGRGADRDRARDVHPPRPEPASATSCSAGAAWSSRPSAGRRS